MVPFGRCVLLWRLKRGLSQAALAQKAGVPRPNLSDIERGEREVSLRTLRALAYALDIRPGILADGMGPEEGEDAAVLTREGMEGIAQSIAAGRPPKPGHRLLSERAGLLARNRLRAATGKSGKPRVGRRAERAWLSLRAGRSSIEVHALLDRIAERQRAGNKR